jgi:hypothetical protein
MINDAVKGYTFDTGYTFGAYCILNRTSFSTLTGLLGA